MSKLSKLRERERILSGKIYALQTAGSVMINMIRTNRIGSGDGNDFRRVAGVATSHLVKERKGVRRAINDEILKNSP